MDASLTSIDVNVRNVRDPATQTTKGGCSDGRRINAVHELAGFYF